MDGDDLRLWLVTDRQARAIRRRLKYMSESTRRKRTIL